MSNKSEKRISWDNFFSHKWFTNDELLDDENNLMNIDFNQSLPNLNNVKNNNQFCSFIHKSVAESENNLELKFLDTSLNESEEYHSALDDKNSDFNSDLDSEYESDLNKSTISN